MIGSTLLRRWRQPSPPPPPVYTNRDFTNAVTLALQKAFYGANGSFEAPQAASGGVAVASAAFARALAGATISASPPVAAALRRVLPVAGASYCRTGEFCAIPSAAAETVLLRPVEIVEGSGTAEAPAWKVREYQPDGNYSDLLAPELLHAVLNPDASGLRGEPPWAGSLGRAAANVEHALGDEGALPLGLALLLNTASEMDDEAVDEFYELAGEQMNVRGIAPMLMQGMSELVSGEQGFMARFGPQYTAAAQLLHAQLAHLVAASCGLPPVLLSANAGGSAYRDGWRSFLSSAVQPVADGIAAAAAAVLGSDVAIEARARHNTPTDLVSRSRAFRSLVGPSEGVEGMEPGRALEVVGLADPS